MSAPNILVLIPARGGSKGVPGKNIRPLVGKPLLAWSIEQARLTPGVTRVVVSTDAEEIAAVARRFGADVVLRPAEISGDKASSESALLHALDHLAQAERYEPDLVVFLQATSPLRESDEIERALKTLHAEGADSLLSVAPMHGFVWRAEAGQARSFTYDHRNRPRRQDAPEDLVENGSIYIFKPWVLRKFNNRLGGKIALHRMDVLKSFQIDDPGDFTLMEAILAARRATTVPDLTAIRLLVLDFDGVLTDNRVLVDQDGREAAWCHRGDGMGLGLVREVGLEVIILSKEKVPIASARARKLGIECVQGCDDKLPRLRELAAARQLAPHQVAYVGNDINDLACLGWVGLPIAVADALPEVKAAARWVTTAEGGRGAVREVCDQFLLQQKTKPNL